MARALRAPLDAALVASVAASTIVLAVVLAGEARLVEMDVSFTLPGESYAYVYPASPTASVGLAVRDRLVSIDGVIPDHVFSFSKVYGGDGRGHGFLINGATRGWVERFSRPPYLDLSQENIDRFNADPDGMIVTDRTLQQTGWHLGDAVTLRGGRAQLHGNVAAIVPAGFARLNKVIMHGEALDDQLQPPLKGRTAWVNVGVRPDKLASATRQIDAAYEAAGDQVWSFDLHAFNAFLLRHFVGHPPSRPCVRARWRQLGEVMGVSTLVIVLSVLSLARRRFGAAAALCALGGLVGAVLARAMFAHDGVALGAWFFQDVTVPWRCAALAFAAACGLGVAVELALFARRRA